jgi:hypothetical protein
MRYTAEGGVLLPQGWHFVEGANRFFHEGSIPASGPQYIYGELINFDEYGKPQ